ncbi:MAG: hypothetical protein AAF705_09170 [Bacteroidota bacterium]
MAILTRITHRNRLSQTSYACSFVLSLHLRLRQIIIKARSLVQRKRDEQQ